MKITAVPAPLLNPVKNASGGPVTVTCDGPRTTRVGVVPLGTMALAVAIAAVTPMPMNAVTVPVLVMMYW